MATINDAVRLMYLTQTGREADPGGLEYFAKRFGADSKIDEDELAIFRQMAPAEVAGQEARRAAAAAQQAAVVNQLTSQLTAAGMSPANFYASGGQLPVTTAGTATTNQGNNGAQLAALAANAASNAGATTAGTTGMSITQAYQQVLGRTPSQQEIDYWTTQFGPDVDATELSTFSVAAQPERAAAPSTYPKIREMYLSVLGREPDAAGLKYFYDRFGDTVESDELDIFKGMTIQEQTANAARNAAVTAGTTTGTTGTGTTRTGTTAGTTAGTVQPITRPPPVRQVTSSQLAPASFAQTAITGTPFTNLYTPATVQQNAPRLSDIQAAAQSANPYQSLMSLTPQRTLSPAYAAQAGQTTANTNLGGFNPAIYNPATAPVTGLLAPGGADGVNNSGDQRGPGTDNFNDGQTGYGVLGNLAGEAQRAGFNTLGGFLASGIPVGAAYKGGSYSIADLAALGNKDAIAALAAEAALAPGRAAANAATIAGFGLDAGDADVGSARGDSSNDGGGGARAGGGATGGGYMAKGGMVTPRQVKGPNPPGPDDGYTGLDIGEYVIKKSAVKKYGSNIFEQINAGKIPAQRLKSLLE